MIRNHKIRHKLVGKKNKLGGVSEAFLRSWSLTQNHSDGNSKGEKAGACAWRRGGMLRRCLESKQWGTSLRGYRGTHHAAKKTYGNRDAVFFVRSGNVPGNATRIDTQGHKTRLDGKGEIEHSQGDLVGARVDG